jgi:hypothetical protein
MVLLMSTLVMLGKARTRRVVETRRLGRAERAM